MFMPPTKPISRWQKARGVHTGGAQQADGVRPAVPFSDSIHQRVDLRAPGRGGRESGNEFAPDLIGLENVGRQPDRMPCRADRLQHERKRVLTVLQRHDPIAGQSRPLRNGIADAYQLRREIIRRAAADRAAERRQAGTQLPRARTYAIHAEEEVEDGAGKREQPAGYYPAKCAARIGLGEEGVHGGEDGAEHIERNGQLLE
jgi:hypothetical protein